MTRSATSPISLMVVWPPSEAEKMLASTHSTLKSLAITRIFPSSPASNSLHMNDRAYVLTTMGPVKTMACEGVEGEGKSRGYLNNTS